MSVLKDNARRSLAGSAVLRGGTVMIGGIKIINQSANNLTIGGTSDTITIGGSTSFAGNQGFGAGGTAVKISAGGTILFCDDANLYWGAANTLQTSSDLKAPIIKLGAGGTKIVTTGGGTIIFREDTTNLYWKAAGQLGTDGKVYAGSDIQSATNVQGLTLSLGTGGTKIVTTGGGTITFASDTSNLYWKAAGQLGTDGKLYASSDIQSATNLITRDAGGTAPVGILATAGAIVVGNLGGTPRLFANVAGTIYQFNGTVL